MRIRDIGSSRCLAFLVGAIVVLFLGCDPVKTTSQTVTIKVTNITTGKAVPDAVVSLKVDFDRAYPLSRESREPAKEWHERSREFWETSPWHSASTNPEGVAQINIVDTAIDRTLGDTSSDERDILSLPFLIRLVVDNKKEDLASTNLVSNSQVKGGDFAVDVLDVGNPKYVEK